MSRKILAACGACVIVGVATGCGGSAFETAAVDGGGHEASAEAPGSGADAGGGAGADADAGAGTRSDASSDAMTVCAPLPATATDVYVDQRFTGPPVYGTQACPFPSIRQGLTAASHLSGNITVHVAGALPSLTYAETGPVAVGANILLLGAGALRTSISASGTCTGGTGTCAVTVAAGGVLDSFTVVSTSGDGIVASAGSPAPVLRNVAAAGCKNWGAVALGAVELGPSFTARSNGGGGVESPAGATGRIHVVGLLDAFDGNTGNGINVDGSALLLFEGGTASGNFQGIRLAGPPPPGGGTHTITNLTASNNKGPGGVVAYNGQTIVMRSSTLLGNAAVGLLYDYVNGSTLDIGTSASGGNVFGGATVSRRNAIAGLRLCGVPSVLAASGDSWGTCPPTQTFVACDAALPNAYSDVIYAPVGAGTGAVNASTGCTTGP